MKGDLCRFICGLVFCGTAIWGSRSPNGWARDSQSAAPARQPRRSNVFLITIDTLRADHIHCYGYGHIRTGALDSLANDGIRFANAFTPIPITNSSHASILTGLLPSRHGVIDFGMPIAPSARTLAEILKEQGYATASFVGSTILDSKTLAPGFDRGFDFYDNFPTHLPKTSSRYVRLERRGMVVVRHAEKWLSRRSPGKPIFAWIHLYDPHDPYEPPPPYDREYAGRPYDGEIAYADSALGSFLKFLKQEGIYDDSLIVVVGDHGEGLGEHGEETHGILLYDATMRVPLIVKLARRWLAGQPQPIAPRGLVLNEQVRTLDILPTVLELENIEPPERLDGASLRLRWSPQDTAAHDRETESERIVFGQTDYPIRFGWAPLRSVRMEGAKYIEAPQPEFYDLRADPGETKNLYEPWNKEVQKLRGLIAELPDHAGSSHGQPSGVSQATIEQLRALGYLGNVPGFTTAGKASLLPDPKDKIKAHNFLHRAMLAMEEGNTGIALKALESALGEDPKSAMTLTQLGEIELDRGDYQRAIDLFAQSLRWRPGDGGTLFDQARALYASGRLSDARDALEASLGVSRGLFDARYLLGKIYAAWEDWDKARDQLQAAVFLDANRPEARVKLAQVFLAQNHPAEALWELQQAKQLLRDSSPGVFDLMSQAYAREGEKTKARQAAARANVLKSKSSSSARRSARREPPSHKIELPTTTPFR